MPTGIEEAALIAGAGGSIFQGLGSIFSSTPDGRVKLPHEMEASQIELLSDSIAAFEQERDNINNAINSLNSIATLQQQIADGVIPSLEGFAALQNQAMRFGQEFGAMLPGVVEGISGDIENIRSSIEGFDFSTGVEDKARKQIEGLLDQPLEEFRDPQVERELQEGEQQLRERLSAQLGPGYENTDAGRRAISTFRQGATEMRFSVSQRGRQEQVNRLQGLIGAAGSARGTQLAGLQTKIGGFQTAANTGMNFANQLQGFQTAGLNAGLAGFNLAGQAQDRAMSATTGAINLGTVRQQQSSVPFSMLQSFGSQNISQTTRNSLSSGGFFDEGFGMAEDDPRRQGLGNAFLDTNSFNNGVFR